MNEWEYTESRYPYRIIACQDRSDPQSVTSHCIKLFLLLGIAIAVDAFGLLLPFCAVAEAQW